MKLFTRKSDLYERIKDQHRLFVAKMDYLARLLTSNKQDFLSEFSEFHRFVSSVHSKLEEDVLFATAIELLETSHRAQMPDIDNAKKEIERLKADHAMLQRLGDEIKNDWPNMDSGTLLSRFSTYKRILLYHDNAEELAMDRILVEAKQEFPGDSKIDEQVNRIVDAYGQENYKKFISPKD